MRKITYDAARAFLDGKSLTIGNTHTDGTNLYLHGNMIATTGKDHPGGLLYSSPARLGQGWKFGPVKNGELKITLAGWPTVTTRERLNGVLELAGIKYRLYQKNHEQYYGPMSWEKIGYHAWIRPLCLTL